MCSARSMSRKAAQSPKESLAVAPVWYASASRAASVPRRVHSRRPRGASRLASWCSATLERGEICASPVYPLEKRSSIAHQLKRIATRVSLGIGRQGGLGGNSSGDIFVAFSTANGDRSDPSGHRELNAEIGQVQQCDPADNASNRGVDRRDLHGVLVHQWECSNSVRCEVIPAVRHRRDDKASPRLSYTPVATIPVSSFSSATGFNGFTR